MPEVTVLYSNWGNFLAFSTPAGAGHANVSHIPSRITFTPGAAIELRIMAENLIKGSQPTSRQSVNVDLVG